MKPTPRPVSPLAAQIGQRIYDKRTEQGLTQADVREAAELSAGGFCDIENGQVRVTVERLVWIAESLDVSIAYFVE